MQKREQREKRRLYEKNTEAAKNTYEDLTVSPVEVYISKPPQMTNSTTLITPIEVNSVIK